MLFNILFGPIVGAEGDEGKSLQVVDAADREVLETIADGLYVGDFVGGHLYRAVVPEFLCLGRVEDAVIAGHFKTFEVTIGRKAVFDIVEVDNGLVAVEVDGFEDRVVRVDTT